VKAFAARLEVIARLGAGLIQCERAKEKKIEAAINATVTRLSAKMKYKRKVHMNEKLIQLAEGKPFVSEEGNRVRVTIVKMSCGR
jgi:hypothetical protein